MSTKTNKCCGCKERFPTEDMITLPSGKFHSYPCASEYGIAKANKLRAKKEKKDHTEAKRRLRDEDRPYQLKKTQQIFNQFIRLRDADDPCISCGRHHSGQYHAGHYRTVGATPEHRFNDDNCHKQCSACNNHLSGNIVNYRINLSNKIGMERLQNLEGPAPLRKYTIDDLKQIQADYKAKIKLMEKEL